MKLLLLFFISLLVGLPGCGKKKALLPTAQNRSVNTFHNPLTNLDEATHLTKKCTTPKTASTQQHAHNILQVALGLRDAARGSAHKIQPIANGELLNIAHINTTLTFSSTCIQNNAFAAVTVHAQRIQDTMHIHCINQTSTEEKPILATKLTLTPVQPNEAFSQEFLTEAFDACEYGYASNEISLKLCQNAGLENERLVMLCRQNGDAQLHLVFSPSTISFELTGCGIETEELLTTIIGVKNYSSTQPKKETIMPKKILFILMPRDFQDAEFSKPYNALASHGYTIDVAGLTSGSCVGSAGTTITPNKILSSMTPADFDQYDAVVIPGGNASPTFLWNNEDVQAVVSYFHEQSKLVATICYASIIPAQAGILKNRVATVYPTDIAKKIFTDNEVIFSDDLCVEHEKERIITAQSPQAIEAFIAALLKQLTLPLILKEQLNG